MKRETSSDRGDILDYSMYGGKILINKEIKFTEVRSDVKLLFPLTLLLLLTVASLNFLKYVYDAV